MNKVAYIVKYHRKKLGFTQEELAIKAGVGIRFIREMEKGKETLQMDKVNQVLALFGFSLGASRQGIDPYDVFWNYFNKPVKIRLANKVIKYGIIIKEVNDAKENKISAWKFVTNNNAIKYQQKPTDALTEIILHSTIEKIEEQ